MFRTLWRILYVWCAVLTTFGLIAGVASLIYGIVATALGHIYP